MAKEKVESKNFKLTKVEKFLMDMELYRSIMKALPFHTYKQAPIEYSSELTKVGEGSGVSTIQCSICCNVCGKIFWAICSASTPAEVWKRCVENIHFKIRSWKNASSEEEDPLLVHTRENNSFLKSLLLSGARLGEVA